ncbi:MAG: alkylphosphonate utilization protein [Pedosphaera sp.]|nr:alkylphosphonate utilization protein [Pedosphaera sp.]
MNQVMELPERYGCVTCGHEWERAAPPEPPDGPRVLKHTKGNCDILINDPKLGVSPALKSRSKSKPIRLGNGDQEISLKMGGIAIGLKARFMRKA